MKLGKNFFRKNQSIWVKPMITYDESKMNRLFSDIEDMETENQYRKPTPEIKHQISMETELYLLLHTDNL